MERCSLLAIIACFTFLLVGCNQLEDRNTHVLAVAHNMDTEHTVHRALVLLDENLREYSAGSMQLKIYPNAQLGNEREAMELLQMGALAMTKVSASPLESFAPEMKVFSLPYIFRDQQHLFNVLDGEIGKELLRSTDPVLFRGLGYYDAGSRNFYSVDRPIRSPDDLPGMKIRVQQSQTSIAMIQSMGGSATPISYGELYTALQQGVVDGAENNLPSFYRSRHYEVAPYLTLDEHTSVPDVLLISLRVWNDLDGQQQTWLQHAVDDSIEYQRELWAQDTENSLEQVKAAGVEVISVDKRLFSERTKTMLESYQGTALGRLLERIAEVE